MLPGVIAATALFWCRITKRETDLRKTCHVILGVLLPSKALQFGRPENATETIFRLHGEYWLAYAACTGGRLRLSFRFHRRGGEAILCWHECVAANHHGRDNSADRPQT